MTAQVAVQRGGVELEVLGMPVADVDRGLEEEPVVPGDRVAALVFLPEDRVGRLADVFAGQAQDQIEILSPSQGRVEEADVE
jgi:hypothetical protein